jgi:hypothetical protein
MLETGLLQPNRVNLGDRQDSAEKTRSDHQGSLENSMTSGSPDLSDRLQNPFVPRDLLIRRIRIGIRRRPHIDAGAASLTRASRL